MDKKLIERINELSRKNKKQGLTPAEVREREDLRQEYLKQFREQFRAQLENIDIEYVDGSAVEREIKGAGYGDN